MSEFYMNIDKFINLTRYLRPVDRKKVCIYFYIMCAERCLWIFERVYPTDNRPRLAIETTKIWFNDSTTENEIIVLHTAAACDISVSIASSDTSKHFYSIREAVYAAKTASLTAHAIFALSTASSEVFYKYTKDVSKSEAEAMAIGGLNFDKELLWQRNFLRRYVDVNPRLLIYETYTKLSVPSDGTTGAPYEGGHECAICFEERLENGELPLIKHSCASGYFHETCLEKWYERNPTCPLCRNRFSSKRKKKSKRKKYKKT